MPSPQHSAPCPHGELACEECFEAEIEATGGWPTKADLRREQALLAAAEGIVKPAEEALRHLSTPGSYLERSKAWDDLRAALTEVQRAIR